MWVPLVLFLLDLVVVAAVGVVIGTLLHYVNNKINKVPDLCSDDAVDKQYLRFENTKYKNSFIQSSDIKSDPLTTVDGHVLRFNGTEYTNSRVAASDISGGSTSGEVIRFNGATFDPQRIAVSDISAGSASAGDMVRFDGVNWQRYTRSFGFFGHLINDTAVSTTAFFAWTGWTDPVPNSILPAFGEMNIYPPTTSDLTLLGGNTLDIIYNGTTTKVFKFVPCFAIRNDTGATHLYVVSFFKNNTVPPPTSSDALEIAAQHRMNIAAGETGTMTGSSYITLDPGDTLTPYMAGSIGAQGIVSDLSITLEDMFI